MSESTVSELEFAAFVAIDWADRKHVWALRDTELLLEILVNHRQQARGIGDADTLHEVVNHSAREYVRGDVHTNTAESVWSLLKRSIIGSFHQVSVKHLPAYLDELEFRFNRRGNPYLFRDTLIRLLGADALTYRELVHG